MSAREERGVSAAPGAARRGAWIFHPGTLLVLRLVLAAVFIYAGAQKVGKPLLFADEIHAYGVIDYGPPVYLGAIVLPWLEILCGAALAAGVMIRGSALALLVLNAVFIAVIAFRSASMVRSGTPFLGVYFDCGCGFGATYAWKKLIEDTLLVAASLVLLAAPVHRFVLSFKRRSS